MYGLGEGWELVGGHFPNFLVSVEVLIGWVLRSLQGRKEKGLHYSL